MLRFATGSAIACALFAIPLNAQNDKKTYQFDFAQKVRGFIHVGANDAYSEESGYGFDQGSKVTIDGMCTSDKPFFFSVAVPEGNYNVTAMLGNPLGESNTTIRAESRRLMLENIKTDKGLFQRHVFTVNVRNHWIAGGGEVRLKDREKNALHWDGKLTLEFRGERPCVRSIAIAKVEDAVTVFIAGDSTVTDQTNGLFAGWGQMLPRFFKPGGVAIANHAESGEALKSFQGEKRLDKILSQIKKGDYLFIQFAHNDMKKGGAYAEANTTYKEHLKHYIAEARKREAIPVLVTPMHRRNFDGNGKVVNTLGDYPEAMRQTAKEEKVALIDLNGMSKEFYEALGPDNSKKAFVDKDNTHTNEFGAYEFARFIAESIKKSDLGLAKHIVDDLPKANFK